MLLGQYNGLIVRDVGNYYHLLLTYAGTRWRGSIWTTLNGYVSFDLYALMLHRRFNIEFKRSDLSVALKAVEMRKVSRFIGEAMIQ